MENNIQEIEKQLLNNLRGIVTAAREYAYKSANLAQVVSNWLIGKKISEQEKSGKTRANYGAYIVKLASESLSEEFGQGYSETNIKSFIKFYLTFNDLSIGQTASAQLKLLPQQIGQMPSALSETPLYSNVCWSHYERLMRVEDTEARRWYLDETHREQWTVKTLRRNINSQYYYRLMQTPSSKRGIVVNEMHTLTQSYQEHKLEFLKNPIIVEFLGFQQDIAYSETKLETAILDHIQEMIMEMGKGYAFVNRQQHIKTDMGDYYIDLVFYNYILKFFLLIDLKMDQPTHQDVGQMDMYRRMYDKLKRTEGDNPTIGLLLCSETSKDLAQFSILHDNSNVFAAKFLTTLPPKEKLLKEIKEQKEIYQLQLEESRK